MFLFKFYTLPAVLLLHFLLFFPHLHTLVLYTHIYSIQPHNIYYDSTYNNMSFSLFQFTSTMNTMVHCIEYCSVIFTIMGWWRDVFAYIANGGSSTENMRLASSIVLWGMCWTRVGIALWLSWAFYGTCAPLLLYKTLMAAGWILLQVSYTGWATIT